jgi:pyrroline-5-carboxylate reductase
LHFPLLELDEMSDLIAFVGGGQMAGSLVGGLLAAGHPASRLVVAEPDGARAEAVRREFKVEVRAGARELPVADALVLAVKPQAMREALAGLALPFTTTVISIAAGIRIDSLRGWLGGSAAPVVRSMPNTPALLRFGVAGLYAPPGTPELSRRRAERVLGAVGQTCWVDDEGLLDAVTALSGSGPAYYFLLTEALRDAGRELGLDAPTAKLLAERTLVGAGRMAESAGRDVAELRANVTSRGGTTEAAVGHLENHGFRALLLAALRAARDRSRELGAALSK